MLRIAWHVLHFQTNSLFSDCILIIVSLHHRLLWLLLFITRLSLANRLCAAIDHVDVQSCTFNFSFAILRRTFKCKNLNIWLVVVDLYLLQVCLIISISLALFELFSLLLDPSFWELLTTSFPHDRLTYRCLRCTSLWLFTSKILVIRRLLNIRYLQLLGLFRLFSIYYVDLFWLFLRNLTRLLTPNLRLTSLSRCRYRQSHICQLALIIDLD